jgi:ubiquinone biosynthesis monooxygenase Coq6
MLLNSSAKRLYLSLGNIANYSSSKKYYDIVIAGGGMVGCAMACKLGNYFSNYSHLSIYQCLHYVLAKEPALRGMSILLLEGGPNRKQYDLHAKKNTLDNSYSNRVSAVNKSSVQLLQSIGAWQTISDLGLCNAIKEMRVSV